MSNDFEKNMAMISGIAPDQFDKNQVSEFKPGQTTKSPVFEHVKNISYERENDRERVRK